MKSHDRQLFRDEFYGKDNKKYQYGAVVVHLQRHLNVIAVIIALH